ncbi:MAG: hypothetical protein I3273_00520 [Candidatus Moeniiplasma glomeromycotorum]|nr:hypothetical protein [Candidatus Moeniiplasma glomeromycotorum]MCE8167391.1 hypothetical protein [Candidatus Moeniiplasma glomeromycotorum]MCE8168596.1 hypothetical protein [Candidatus Moeniiplasma glomeromycotorum]
MNQNPFNGWQFISTPHGNNQLEFNFYKPDGSELTWENFLSLCENKNSDFNTVFRSALNSAADQFGAYFWNCLPVSQDTLNRPFRFVVTKSEALKNATQDWKSFSEHLAPLDKPAVSFLARSKAGILVVPKVTKSGNQELDYKNINQFTKNAPEEQQKDFWQKVALEMRGKLNQSKNFCFLNTHGLGVSYLHVWVCEKQPRYWNYNEYLKFDKNISVPEIPRPQNPNPNPNPSSPSSKGQKESKWYKSTDYPGAWVTGVLATLFLVIFTLLLVRSKKKKR